MNRAQEMAQIHDDEVYALLWVTRACEREITDFLIDECGFAPFSVQKGLHLTVYYARRRLDDLVPYSQSAGILSDTAETRFMVLAPGGENPRQNLEPSRRSVGIRLTRRNSAMPGILCLREEMYSFETRQVLGSRAPSSGKRNAFGARHFQPHIKLLRPGSGVDRDLTELGERFRTSLDRIEFDKFEVRSRPRRR